MKFIPANCFVSKRALFSSLLTSCFSVVFSAFSAYSVFYTYVSRGEFHGGKNGNYISYGIEAAVPAYGLSLTWALISLYSIYFIICCGVYLRKNNFLLNSKNLNLSVCTVCKKALQIKNDENQCPFCNSDIVDLKNYLIGHKNQERHIDFSLIPPADEAEKSWDTVSYVFVIICSTSFTIFVLWAYFSDLIVQ